LIHFIIPKNLKNSIKNKMDIMNKKVDNFSILKQKISQLEKEITKNNEENDQIIISLDACLAAKNQIIRELKQENENLRSTIDRLKLSQSRQNKRSVMNNFFGL